MLQESTPPTDSLYKFLAIGGLAVVVVVLVFATDQVADITNRGNEYNIELAQWRAESEWGQAHAAPTTAPSSEPLGGLSREAYTRVEVLKAKRSALDTLMTLRSQVIGVGGAAVGVGLIIAVLGFSWWWQRQQKLQDQLLALELEERRAKRQLPSGNPAH